MGVVASLDAKGYRNTGSYAAPTWAEIENIKDLTVTGTSAEGDASVRASDFMLTEATLKDVSIGFEMNWDPADADFVAFRDAWLNRTKIECAFLDGPIGTAGSQGPRASFSVTEFTRNEPLDGILTVNVTIKPAYATNLPEWHVTGS